MAGRDREIVEREAAVLWLEREIWESDREITAYVQRYAVASPDELERLIRSGGIEGHPAWEDRIEWGKVARHVELHYVADIT